MLNLLPGLVMGMDLSVSGNFFELYTGTSIFKWDTIFVFIFKDFLEDLSMIDANPNNLAFAFFISLTHSKLDFPVVITSSIIKTLAPLWI